ncbi:unnamed protein product [Heterobilharzia americana]|nr:unnamed protein product [Heterobilharzia americana]
MLFQQTSKFGGNKKCSSDDDDINESSVLETVTYKASHSKESRVTRDQMAAATSEIDTDMKCDAQSIFERAQKVNQETQDRKLYKGMNNYAQYIEKKDTVMGNASSGFNRKGPMRAPANLRATVRWDYQPDICKDYKETGFCSFGDSCKFLHDRSDYKHGWQIEQELAEGVYGIDGEDNRYEITHNSSGDEVAEDIPLVCMICRKDFKDPVVTICKHYFCSDCALKRYKKTARCYACTTDTKGFFKFAKNLLARIAILREKKKKHSDLSESDQEEGEEIHHHSCSHSSAPCKDEPYEEDDRLNNNDETECNSPSKVKLPQSSEPNWAKPEAPEYCDSDEEKWMEDFYNVLGCTMNATEDEIKRFVNQARLKFHPDKNSGTSRKEFLVVERAWSILQCPEKRKVYDALLKQSKVLSHSGGLPVQGDIPLSEFHRELTSPDSALNFEPGNEDCSIYWLPCRCGGNYILDNLSVLCQVLYAKCTDCSLLVRVLYPESYS